LRATEGPARGSVKQGGPQGRPSAAVRRFGHRAAQRTGGATNRHPVLRAWLDWGHSESCVPSCLVPMAAWVNDTVVLILQCGPLPVKGHLTSMRLAS
jgi:hypothetical protein